MAATAPNPFLVAADLLDPPDDPYRHDPKAWAWDVLGFWLWSKQQQIAESVRDHERTAVRSGHGVGKTASAAVIALWFLDCFLNSRVITTATKWSQVEVQLWHEIGQLHARARHRPQAAGRPIFRAEPLKTRLELPDGRYALGLSSKPENSESFAGHHAPNLLVIYDEASGVHPKIFEVGEGYMTTAGARALLVGNPTRGQGELYDAFHSKRPDYNTIHISAMDSPAVTGEWVPEEARRALTGPAWIESRRRVWGESSPMFQVRVAGNFPRQSTNMVVSLGDVEDAQARELPGDLTQDRVTITCDVARFGDDETVIAQRIGREVRILETYVGQRPPATAAGPQRDDLVVTAGRIAHYAKQFQHIKHVLTIVIDDTGVGGGVTDILRSEGWQVTAFNGAEAAIEGEDYPNRRSELWFTMRDEIPTLDLDGDDQLAADLTAPVYTYNKHGQRVVERKDETKKRLGRSPDRADAVLLTLVRPLVITTPDGQAEDLPAMVGGGDWDASAPTGDSLTGDLLEGDM